MSRVGKSPIKIPGGVKVTIGDGVLEIIGKKAKLSSPIPAGIHFKLEGDELTAHRESDDKPLPGYHGLARALAANNVIGVTQGFSKSLDVVGIGYKVDAKKHTVTFSLGYSHPIEFPIPEGIEVKLRTNNWLGRLRLTCVISVNRTPIKERGSDTQVRLFGSK